MKCMLFAGRKYRIALLSALALMVMALGMGLFVYAGSETATSKNQSAAEETTVEVEPDAALEQKIVMQLPGSDAMMLGFVDSSVDEGSEEDLEIAGAPRYSKLTAKGKEVYKLLAKEIRKIALDRRSSTSITINLKKAGITGYTFADAEKDLAIMPLVLMASMPYELYWYDKTSKCDCGATGIVNVDNVTIMFPVADKYKGTGDYTTDTSVTGAVADSIQSISRILDAYANAGDIAKLEGYAKEVMRAVDYDYSSANDNVAYGDPWQLINVFDGDASTKVVCEGYSKAFQYLCDRTSFSNTSISTDSVSGVMKQISLSGESLAGGNHMWNVVHINGANYLADVTNADILNGSNDDSEVFKKLFLTGGDKKGSFYAVETGNTNALLYYYDAYTENVFESSALALSGNTYYGTKVSVDWVNIETGSGTGEITPHDTTGNNGGSNGTNNGTGSTQNTNGTGNKTTGGSSTGGTDTNNGGKTGNDTQTMNPPNSSGQNGGSIVSSSGETSIGSKTTKKTVKKVTKPGKVKISKVKAGKKRITIQWKRISKNTKGYQIQITDRKTGKVKTIKVKQAKKGKTMKKVVKGLKKKNSYKVRVRAYNTSGKKTAYGKWSAAKTVKVK